MARMRNGMETWLKKNCVDLADTLYVAQQLAKTASVSMYTKDKSNTDITKLIEQAALELESLLASGQLTAEMVKLRSKLQAITKNNLAYTPKNSDELITIASEIRRLLYESLVECQCGKYGATPEYPAAYKPRYGHRISEGQREFMAERGLQYADTEPNDESSMSHSPMHDSDIDNRPESWKQTEREVLNLIHQDILAGPEPEQEYDIWSHGHFKMVEPKRGDYPASEDGDKLWKEDWNEWWESLPENYRYPKSIMSHSHMGHYQLTDDNKIAAFNTKEEAEAFINGDPNLKSGYILGAWEGAHYGVWRIPNSHLEGKIIDAEKANKGPCTCTAGKELCWHKGIQGTMTKEQKDKMCTEWVPIKQEGK